MASRSRKNNKKQELGFFKSINLNENDGQINEFIIKIQRSSSNLLDENIFADEFSNIENVEIWTVFDSEYDINLSKVDATRLKDTFLASPIAVLRLLIKGADKNKIINLLVKDLFVVSKTETKSVYIRFSSEFEVITVKEVFEKYKESLLNESDDFKQRKSVILSNQKRKINKKYVELQKYYKMTKNKEYEVNLFSKMDYHHSRIDVLKEFIYNEVIKTVLFSEEIPKILGGKNNE